MSVRLRPADGGTADVEAAGEVVWAAFGAQDATHGDQVVRLVGALRDAGHVRAEVLAEEPDADGGPAVGHVMLTRAWLDARERLVEVLVLSPLSVRPDRQRLGVGSSLVGEVRRLAERQGAPALFLEGSPRYYGERGFSAAGPLGFAAPSDRIPAPAFQVVVLPAHEPWMRGRLVYPDTFWAHDCVGLRDPLLAELERGDAGG